jgi:hypothetical protein
MYLASSGSHTGSCLLNLEMMIERSLILKPPGLVLESRYKRHRSRKSNFEHVYGCANLLKQSLVQRCMRVEVMKMPKLVKIDMTVLERLVGRLAGRLAETASEKEA